MIRMPTEPTNEWVEVDELMTGEAVALDLRPTGFALRAGGTIIDVVLSIFVYGILMTAVSIVASTSAWEMETTIPIAAIVGLVLCIVVAPAAVETLSHGKSLGRLAVGARIVRDDGGAAGFRHAIIRSLVGVIELYLTLGGIAALVGVFNPRTKRLGDLLAGTYSQYERVSGSVPPVFGAPLPLVAWSRTADVARMPDELARRIRQFLAQAPSFDPTRRTRVARDLANEAARYVSPIPVIDPELFLAGVVVARRERESTALRLEGQRLGRVAVALDDLPHGFPRRG